MDRMILVTGGSGSGKSAWAENRVIENGQGPYVYLATMRPQGEDAEERIRRHREMRAGKGFVTLERYTDLDELTLPAELRGGTVLLEDLSNLLANEMFGSSAQERCDVGRSDVEHCDMENCADNVLTELYALRQQCTEKVMDGLRALRQQCAVLVIVTNEIFHDGVQYDPVTTAYMQTLAEINLKAACMADEVTEVVCGLPLFMKGRKTV